MSYVTTDIAMKQKFRRYSLGIIAITFLVHFLQPALSTQTMNLFYTYLTQLHGWSRSEIALALTIASWVSIPGSFFFATLVIQYDPRLITALCIIGSGLCFLAIGRTSSYAVYLIAFILSYQFTRGMVLGGLQACTNWYISTRGRVLGIVTIGSPAASAVFANAVTRGIEATGSFSRVYTIIGVLVILLGILSAPLLRPAPEPLGLQPDGLPRSPEELARLKEFSAQTGGWNVKRLFTTKETWFLCVGWTCMFFVMTCFMTIFIPRMLEIGVDYPEVEVEVIPGVTAATGGAAVLGAPLIHDFALISLSDLLTPWVKIEKRLLLASEADFVICLYNPSSHKRKDYLQKACDLMLQHKAPETVCGLVQNIGREGETYHILTLQELRDTQVDMFTTVFVGNSMTKEINGKMVTPRGYRHGKEE